MNKTADGWAVDVGDTVYVVEHDSWWCNIEKKYIANNRVQHADVVSVGDNGKAAVTFVEFSNGSRTVVRVVPVAELYSIRAMAEAESKK